jgi:hypothetical protein
MAARRDRRKRTTDSIASATEGFHPPFSRRRESFVLYAAEKAGKTTCALQIARQLLLTNSPARMHYLDTDYAVWELLEQDFPELLESTDKGTGPLVLHEVEDWEALDTATKLTLANRQPGDWVVVDLIGMVRDMVRDYGTQKFSGMGIEDYMADAARKAKQESKKSMGGAGTALDPQMYWAPINARYRKWFKPLVGPSKMHSIFIAGVKDLSDDWDKQPTHDTYGTRAGGPGSKPDADKHLGYAVHQIAYLRKAKDKRTRETVRSLRILGRGQGKEGTQRVEPLEDFARDVLVGVRGWEGYVEP